MADSGRVGEVSARVGWVRSLDFLSILRGVFLLPQACRPSKFCCAKIAFPQPARKKKTMVLWPKKCRAMPVMGGGEGEKKLSLTNALRFTIQAVALVA